VYEATSEAVARARRAEGPTLIECKTYRHRGHSRFEKPTYRTDEELQAWLQRDPLPRFRAQLLTGGVLTFAEAERIEHEIQTEIEDAVAFARQSPDPPPDVALRYVYAMEPDPLSP
jgi:TPP-dependent pyruvate/acetoin dehydrogenase alpha subunit